MEANVTERARPTLVTASTQASLAAVLGYIPGFFIPIVSARLFGATRNTDAFFLALSAASLIAGSLGTSTQQAAIPFLIRARRDGEDVSRFIDELSTLLLLLSLIPIILLGVGVLAYTRYLTHWPLDTQRVLLYCVLSLVPYVACSMLAGVYSGVLNAEHLYAKAALSPAIRSLIVLGLALAARETGVYGLAAGYVLGELLRVVYLLHTVKRRTSLRLLAWPKSTASRHFSATAVAQMLGAGLLALVPLLDRTMAAQLSAGSVSLLDYADRLWQVPIAFAMSGFMVTSLSHWSERLYDGGGTQRLARDTASAALLVALVFLPFTIGFLIFRTSVVALVFGSARFSTADLDVLTAALSVLSVATPIYVAGLTYARAFLVLKRSDWLLGVNVIQVVVKIVLNALLVPRMGIVGIAAATASMFVMSSVLLMLLFHGRLVRFADSSELLESHAGLSRT